MRGSGQRGGNSTAGGGRQEAAGITFNGRIVFVDEVALNQLNGEARFTDATATNNDELVLSHKLARHETLAMGGLRWWLQWGHDGELAGDGGNNVASPNSAAQNRRRRENRTFVDVAIAATVSVTGRRWLSGKGRADAGRE